MVTKFLPHFLARQFQPVRSENFPGVVIPLEHAQRHHSVVAKAEKNGEKLGMSEDVEKGSSSSEKDLEGPGRRSSVAAYDVHTIEGLRAEIDSDLAAFGASDSAYDRTLRI